MELINNYQLPEGYKKTEVGIPDWKVLRIKDIAPLQRGFDLPTSQLKKGNYPVVYSNGVMNYHSEFMVKGPGVITGRSGTIGNVHYVSENYWPHNTALWVTDFIDSHPKYIYYLYKSLKLERFGTGSGVPTLNRNDVHDLTVAIPKLEEQKVIAQTLSDVDALIAALDKHIAKKRNIKTGTMQQLLTGKTRLPGLGEGKGYKKSAIGVIPENWDIEELGSIGKFKNGINKSSEDFGHGSPFVNLMDVFGVRSISEVEHLGLVHSNDAEKNVYNLKEGDVIFIRSSVKPSGVGLTTVITRDLPDTVYSGFLIRFRDNDTLETDFKKYCFAEEKFRRNVIANSTVSANTNINQDSLKKLALAYPKSSKEQKAIAKVLSDIDTEITALEKRRAKTQAIKQGMMQELLTGRTRLKIEHPDDPITKNSNG